MRNEQQFDALDCMAINSYRYVMLPRLLAALFCVPMLTAVFDLVGIGGVLYRWSDTFKEKVLVHIFKV